MNQEKIRYGKTNKGQRKNTLITVANKNGVFFGISRCNRKDAFNKELGKKIARNRLQLCINNVKDPDFFSIDEQIIVPAGRSGLYGFASDVKALLDYFHKLK